MAHECVHAAYGPTRLNTQKVHATRGEYAVNEPIKTIGTRFLAIQLGVGPHFDQIAACIKGWLSVLKSEQDMIFKAAAEA